MSDPECGPTHWDACPCRRAQYEAQDHRLTTASIQNVKLESRIGQLEQALRDIIHVSESHAHCKHIAQTVVKK
jgi:hypothetical protein